MEKKRQLIKVENLHKSFGQGELQKTILQGISLSVYRKDFVAITGSSGSGKSTLLSILGLLDDFQEGDYFLCDENVKNLDRYQNAVIRNRNIGWIFQNFNLVSDMTALENVTMPLKYDNTREKSCYHRLAVEALSRVGLSEKATHYPSELSGGQQQRVAIARAIVNEPDILLADEPTGNLDNKNEKKIFDLLSTMNRDGTTILMVTHSLELATLCDRQINLIDGQIV